MRIPCDWQRCKPQLLKGVALILLHHSDRVIHRYLPPHHGFKGRVKGRCFVTSKGQVFVTGVGMPSGTWRTGRDDLAYQQGQLLLQSRQRERTEKYMINRFCCEICFDLKWIGRKTSMLLHNRTASRDLQCLPSLACTSLPVSQSVSEYHYLYHIIIKFCSDNELFRYTPGKSPLELDGKLRAWNFDWSAIVQFFIYHGSAR